MGMYYTSADHLPATSPVDPFRLDEAYVISQTLPAPEEYLRPPTTDYVTMTGVLEAISNGPQSHAKGRNRSGRAPMWALVCFFLGAVLTGFSMVAYAFMQGGN